MIEQRFKIGDKAWAAYARQSEKWVTCPDCMGTGKLTCILGNGDKIGFDCSCCDRQGFVPSGKVRVYEFQATAELVPITGFEMRSADKITYHSGDECCYRNFKDADLYTSQEEALSAAEIKKTEQEIDEQKRLVGHKDQARGSWAHNVTYHTGCIRKLEKDLAYHKSKLEVAKSKAEVFSK